MTWCIRCGQSPADEQAARIVQLELELSSANKQIVHLSGERDLLACELGDCRTALIDAGRTVGCLLEDEVLTHFLLHVPEEVRVNLKAERERAERAEAAAEVDHQQITALTQERDSTQERCGAWCQLASAMVAELRQEFAPGALPEVAADCVAAIRKVRKERDTQAAEVARLREALADIKTIASTGPFSHPQRDPYDEICIRAHAALSASTTAGSELLKRLRKAELLLSNRQAADKIFTHKHLDITCVSEGCQSLFLIEAHERIAQLEGALDNLRRLLRYILETGNIDNMSMEYRDVVREAIDKAKAALSAPVAQTNEETKTKA